jgi:hypothetical protein
MRLGLIGLAALGSTWLVLSACSTPTTISDVWRDPSYSAGPMRKIFVVGGTRNETNRRSLEDSFAASLSQHSVAAMASYRVFPGHPDRDTVKQYLQAQGYDGALVVKLRGVNTQTTLVPDANFGWYWGYAWGPDYYVETDQYVKVESSLWDAHSAKLVWSAVTETANPSSSSDAIQSIVGKVTSTLTKEGLIPSTPAVASRGTLPFI